MKNIYKLYFIYLFISIPSTFFSQCTGTEPVLFLGNDTTYCTVPSITLTAPSGYNYYDWSDNTHNQTLNVTAAGTYSVEIGIVGANLVVNGNFESGNTGFTSSYTTGGSGAWGPLSNPGTYAVVTSPNLAHSNFSVCTDHTVFPGTKMMVVNGSGTPNSLVWTQTVAVTANKDYQLGAWICNALNDPNVGVLQFYINNVAIGSTFTTGATACAWTQFTDNWNSGASTSAVLKIVNQNTINSGNDFAIDDITFSPLCKKTDTIIIGVSAAPTQTTAMTSVTNCTGPANGSITVTSATGTQYSFDGGLTWQASNVKTGLAIGTYTVMTKNAAGCTVSSVVTVTSVLTMPSQTTSFVAPTSCTGTPDGSITLTSPTAVQYSYDAGVTWLPTSTQTGLAAGSYTVMSENASGCSTSSVVVLTNPGSTITQTTAFVSPVSCTGTPDGSITITSATAVQYSYDNGVTWVPTNVQNGLAGGTYTVMSQDVSGCTTSSIVTLTPPVSTITQTTAFVSPVSCTGTPDGSITITSATAVQYSYDNGVTWVPTNIQTGLNGGVYTVMSQDISGCTVSSTVTLVAVISTITQTTTFVEPSLCTGLPDGAITITSATAVQYSFDGGVNWQASNVQTGLASGTYTVMSKNSAGCTTSSIVTLTGSSSIVSINVSPDVVVCQNGTTILSALGSGGTSFIYHWTDFTSTTATQTASPTFTGYYVVQAENQNGCLSAKDSILVTVLPALDALISNAVSICPSQTTNLSVSNITGGLAPYTVVWTLGASIVGTGNTLVSNVSSTSNYVVAIKDACESTILMLATTVNVTPFVLPFFTIDNASQCEPAVFTIDNTLNPSQILSSVWEISNGDSYMNQNEIVLTDYAPGTYDVSLSVVSIDGCTDTVILANALTVYPKPIPNFSFNPTVINAIDPTVNLVNQSTGALTYVWDIEKGSPNSAITTDVTTVFPIGEPGTYNVVLTAISDHQCVDSILHQIVVIQDQIVYVPNTFTPNGDNLNNTWKFFVSGFDTKRNFDMTVFNRWGEIIWHTSDMNAEWDGFYKGNLVADGVYSWTLVTKDTVSDKKYFHKGSLNIIR